MIRFIQKYIRNNNNFLALVVIANVIVLTAFSAAQAAALFAPEPCDPDYYESLKSRAWLEAQREITQNQNLIYKPDSVLEYSCFDRFLRELADHGGTPLGANKMFTGTNRWGANAANMAGTLTTVVGSAIDSYDTANFNHNLLGGRSAGLNYNIPGAVAGGNYTCDVMDRVWREAKCTNFIANAATDGFFTFDHYAGSPDKRFLPTPCAASPLWSQEIDTAVGATTPWEEDDVKTYYGLIYPAAGCGPAAGTDSSKIKTGLIVRRSSGGISNYDEYACIVPGCYYNPTGVATGNCIN